MGLASCVGFVFCVLFRVLVWLWGFVLFCLCVVVGSAVGGVGSDVGSVGIGVGVVLVLVLVLMVLLVLVLVLVLLMLLLLLSLIHI